MGGRFLYFGEYLLYFILSVLGEHICYTSYLILAVFGTVNQPCNLCRMFFDKLKEMASV